MLRSFVVMLGLRVWCTAFEYHRAKKWRKKIRSLFRRNRNHV